MTGLVSACWIIDPWRSGFVPQRYKACLDEHDSGRANHGKKLWALLIFAVWSKQVSPAIMFKNFDFGSNWAEFSKRHVDRQRLESACESMRALLGTESIVGKSFIDIGCGSGLFSIAAHRLGAVKVVGIDVNPRCIEIAQANRDLLAPGAPIEFHIASVLDARTTQRIWNFRSCLCVGLIASHRVDVECGCVTFSRCVAPGGILVLAIYNKHSTSPAWRSIKWFYNQVPQLIQRFMIFIFAGVIYTCKIPSHSNQPVEERARHGFLVRCCRLGRRLSV